MCGFTIPHALATLLCSHSYCSLHRCLVLGSGPHRLERDGVDQLRQLELRQMLTELEARVVQSSGISAHHHAAAAYAGVEAQAKSGQQERVRCELKASLVRKVPPGQTNWIC